MVNYGDHGKGNGSLGGSLLAALIFLIIGGGLSFWGWNILSDARSSSSWPTVQGVILESRVAHSRDSDGHDSYKPEVRYSYLANKQSRKSHNIKFGENSYDSKRTAEKIAANYPIGKKVKVYYNPKKPEKSVLEPGVTSGSYIVIGIGVLFVVIALLIPPLTYLLRRHTSY